MNYDLEFAKYLELPYISASDLEQVKKSPYTWKYGQIKETPAMNKGTLVHTLELEPEKFRDRYEVTDLTRKGTKEWKSAAMDALPKILIKQAELDEALGCVKSPCDEYRRYMTSPGKSEVSCYNDEGKCRFDRLLDDGSVVDLKTLSNVKDINSFYSYTQRIGWPMRVAHYTAVYAAEFGHMPTGFYLCCAETDGPETWVASVNLEGEWFEDGVKERAKYMDIIQEIQFTEQYARKFQGIIEL